MKKGIIAIVIALSTSLMATGLQSQYITYEQMKESALNNFKKDAVIGSQRCRGRIVVDEEAAHVRKYPVLRKTVDNDVVGVVYKNMVLYYENRINGFYELCGGNTFIYSTVVTRID